MSRALTLDLFAPQPAPAPAGQPEPKRAPPRLVRARQVPPDGEPQPRVRPAQLWLAIHLPHLPAEEPAEQHQRERLARLAAWCQKNFTPLVSLEPPDELLLELKGSLRLFGGARALIGRIAAGLRAQGVTAQLALTPTPRGALWLARAGGEKPSPHPSPASGRGSKSSPET